MKCNKCKEEATHRVDGYAECGQDGGYVYQPYCATHLAELEEIMAKFIAAGEDEFMVSSDAIQDFTGLEFITEVSQWKP